MFWCQWVRLDYEIRRPRIAQYAPFLCKSKSILHTPVTTNKPIKILFLRISKCIRGIVTGVIFFFLSWCFHFLFYDENYRLTLADLWHFEFQFGMYAQNHPLYGKVVSFVFVSWIFLWLNCLASNEICTNSRSCLNIHLISLEIFLSVQCQCMNYSYLIVTTYKYKY